jgi:tetratricopeptide (TPR) repeat protein
MLTLLLPLVALAQESDLDGETITGDGSRPAVRVDAVPAQPADIVVEQGDAKYPALVYAAAESLSLEDDFLGGCWEATQLLYKRDYAGSKKAFKALDDAYPGRGVGGTGEVLIYQALMMENFDFAYEQPYEMASDRTIKELDFALKAQGNDAWEHFLMGMLMGVESVHTMRQEQWLPAISRGLEAVEHIDASKRMAPGFKDPLMADGLFKYWRSAVALSSKAIPDGEDQRAEGMKDLMEAERGSVFFGPGASLALAFSYIEEGDLDQAKRYTRKNLRAYPTNVINGMVHSRVLIYQSQYDDARKALDRVAAIDPDNKRVHYYYGTVFLRLKQPDEAEEHLTTYLSYDGLEDYQLAGSYFRMGNCYWQRKDYDTAEKWYRKAVKADGHKGAKSRLDRIKEMRKDGRI